ncbi:MAG: ABC transporter permease subunit [Leptospiraceae bacterium]|nr:ABC transporter permease subunit [Leptospiraceae bacterium]
MAFFLSVFIGLVLYYPPTEVELETALKAPFQDPYHILGKDRLGRDIYALYSYGILSTFVTAIPARLLTLSLAALSSLLSFSLGKYFETVLQMFSSVLISLPSLLIALVVVNALNTGFFAMLLAIILSDWAMTYESVQSKIREILGSGQAIASRAMGAGKIHIFKNHILPETRSIFYVLFITGIPSVIMTIAIFSFLGIDFTADVFGPGLGEQISFSKDYFDKSPLSLIMPTIGIFLLVYSFRKR